MTKTLRILFLADSQLGLYASFSGMSEQECIEYERLGMKVDPVPRTDSFEWDARMYERAIEAANALRPDLVIFGGDMIDDPSSEDQLETYLAITGELDADIPMRFAPGNHDIAPDTVVPTSESVAAYREVYGDDYYTFDLGPASFLVLNTVVMDHPERVPDEWARQQAFIDDRLGGSGPAPIVVGHHPLFIDTVGEDDTYWNVPRDRRIPLVEKLHGAGVTLAIAGHWHRNNIAWDGDLEVVTSGPVGYPLGDDPSGFRLFEIAESGAVTHRYIPLDADAAD